MPPEHKSPRKPERTALAPYNFVPLPPKVLAFDEEVLSVDHSQYDRQRWTGWIDVTIETKSPLYIRGGLSPKDYEQMQAEQSNDQINHLDKVRNRPDFFTTTDKNHPVIPGSSLRGMIRTLVEIVGHGKMQPVSDRKLIYRAIGGKQANTQHDSDKKRKNTHTDAYRNMLMWEDETQNKSVEQREGKKKKHFIPKFKGGFVRVVNERYYIQPAPQVTVDDGLNGGQTGVSHGRIYHSQYRQLKLNPWAHSRQAYQTYIKPTAYQYQSVRGGHIQIARVHTAAISATPQPGFIPAVLTESNFIHEKKSEAFVFLPDDMDTITPDKWILIPDGLDEEGDDLLTDYKEQISPEQAKLLGPRGLLQDKQPVFYVEQAGKLIFFGHTAMFRVPFRHSPQAMLPKEHRATNSMDLAEAMFGKVKKSSDGQGVASRIFVTDAPMKDGEKEPWFVSAEGLTPHILAGPKPTTFQHYLTQTEPDGADGANLFTYNNSPAQTTLRGYKLYWHKDNVSAKDLTADPQKVRKAPKQYTKIRPVRAGVTFRGRIYFENLQDIELGALWWALTLPGAKQEVCHKLGMGKPLGLGAVKITAVPTIQSISKRYKKLFGNEAATTWQPATHSKTMSIIEQAQKLFERFVQEELGQPSFAEVPRIQELLAMLAFPGPEPDPAYDDPKPDPTRYLEIERNQPTHLPEETTGRKRERGINNEYRTRPVLPLPSEVPKANITPTANFGGSTNTPPQNRR